MWTPTGYNHAATHRAAKTPSPGTTRHRVFGSAGQHGDCQETATPYAQAQPGNSHRKLHRTNHGGGRNILHKTIAPPTQMAFLKGNLRSDPNGTRNRCLPALLVDNETPSPGSLGNQTSTVQQPRLPGKLHPVRTGGIFAHHLCHSCRRHPLFIDIILVVLYCTTSHCPCESCTNNSLSSSIFSPRLICFCPCHWQPYRHPDRHHTHHVELYNFPLSL